MLRKGMFLAGLILACAGVQAAEPVPLADFARHMQFKDVKISPDGKHLAATAIVGGNVVLSMIDLGSNTALTVQPRNGDDVFEFWWVSNERIVYAVAQHGGALEQPIPTGELYATNVDGKARDILFGYRASESKAGSTGSHIETKQNEYASAWILEALPDDAKYSTIVVQPWSRTPGESIKAEVRRIDLASGKTRTVATAPMTGAQFITDHKGVVRFAVGNDVDQKQKVYYREADGKDWELISSETGSGVVVWPIMFNRAGDGVYFECGGAHNRGGVCQWDVGKREFKTLWSGLEVGPSGFEETFDRQDLFAIRSMPGRTAVALLDKNAAEAKLLVELMQQFPGEDVHFGNASRDGKKVIVVVDSDRDPGSFYLYDAEAKKLKFLLARAPWIKPDALADMQPFSIKARDGMPLRGYLTRPFGKEETKRLPMVVFVHGGPHGVFDQWEYDPTVQALASRGYAVLQVNYRGSGGSGLAFQKAGYGEWGGKMQDDVTDATRWAIEQEAADPKRICIFGGSYGGYAALQGAVREPDLYRCAIGYAGVYDLRLMKSRGDIPQTFRGEGYLDMVLGKDDALLAQRSPVNQVERIKADVMLIVGGQDKRVPPVQGENMRSALLKRGKKVEWLYQRTEAHGFYDEANVTDMYTRLLAFIDRNIGAGSKHDAVADEPAAPAAKD
ncbi:MAG TPA: S9 family peptidase [Dokdonella sp.]|uniref:S9 family peptidase n=2 Tax=Dokdonella sp. TaxID=2291710 RepID=UPI002C484339|nr:S9 family peptidase [Xanthomonadales bacterium]MBK7211009.1 S9 family peptidase [Xanthomonadales bacterium]HQW76433.1 S9 family peptidase [Dokdonella sp.]HQY55059.1 S9 family peptidase [Dokdonella sp.]